MDKVRQTSNLKKLGKKKPLIYGAVALLVMWLATGLLTPKVPEIQSDSFWFDEVKQGELTLEVGGSGILRPRELRRMASNVEGRIEKIYVKPGDTVAQGDVLIELFNPDVKQQANEYRLKLEAEKAKGVSLKAQLDNERIDLVNTLEGTRSEYDIAALKVEANEKLEDEGIVSGIDVQAARLEFKMFAKRIELFENKLNGFDAYYNAQLDAQQAVIEELKFSYQHKQQQEESLYVRSAIAGVVQDMLVEAGERINKGEDLTSIAKPGDLIAEIQIPETRGKDIATGLQASIDTRNGVVKGHVYRIAPLVKNGTIQVDIELDEALPEGARADLNIDGTIQLQKFDNVVHIQRPARLSDGENAVVFVLNQDKTEAKKRNVSFGKSSLNRIQIVKGLEPGELVILSDLSEWADADTLAIRR